ncbi:SGNH/GDSL hydrolase family protein [Tellurirhabdus rosea]|uniref:SGNH/GDSL hydrolase family protein n=1 Tax=Tellurirhabdus rosea TaxID=2674997 RepID=UPI0022592901|nr:SGNH/GDSL hydrolase family protein [Tellurirhabdus rosea]
MKWFERIRWGLLLLTVVGVTSCTQEDDDNLGPAPVRGEADFTKYVAVGNSLTAGFADGGLYRESQLNSYPNMLAKQFGLVGGGTFVQPLFSADSANGSGYVRLIRLPQSPVELLTSLRQIAPGAVRTTVNGRPLYSKFTGANNNLGVPGIRMSDVLSPGYGSAQGNPYFERLLPGTASTRTYLDYVGDNLNGATFFTCWMGNNDVLGYTTSGGVNAMTTSAVFTTNYTALLNKLTENNRKGVVVGIPNTAAAPYFRTITIPLLLAQLNASRPAGTPVIPALVIQTAAGPRASRDGDLLMLPNALEYLKIGTTTAGTGQGPYGLSATNPLPTQFVLDSDEAAAAFNRLTEFNNLMKQQAEAKGLVFVDPNQVLTQLGQTGGYLQDGVTYNLSFIQGGAVSLDGIHLTPAGYALIANEIIKGINTKYKSTLPLLNTSTFNRVLLQAQ